MAVDVTLQELFDVGAHFGHQTNKWNPKMRPFIYGSRSGIHILDLQQTVGLAQKALKFIEDIVASGQDVLFVGTKQQAQEIVEQEAQRAQMHFITNRWLGGALTNFGTIKKSIERLIELETRREKNDFVGFTKKERLEVDRTIEKLTQTLGGIKKMRKLPGAIFMVDPVMEKIAVHEANILGISVIAIADSNCNPDPIDYVIPANDDAVRAIGLIASRVADACLAGLEKREQKARQDDSPKTADEQRKPARRTKQVSGAGKAFVSKADAFEGKTEEASFSAAPKEVVQGSLAAELNQVEGGE